MYTSLFLQTTISRISAIFIVFIVATCLAFCWYQWKMMRIYRRFPSKRFDVDWTLRILTGRYPKGVTMTHFVFQELVKTMNSLLDKGLCVFWIIKPRILVFNENLVKYLMNEADLSDKGGFLTVNKIFFGNGLLASKHDAWKVQRKLLNPAFSVSMLKSGVPSLNKYASQLVDEIDTFVDKPVENIWEILKRPSLESMYDYVLGLKPERFEHLGFKSKGLVDRGTVLAIEKLVRPWLHLDFLLPLFKLGREYLKLNDCKNDIIGEVINLLKNEHLKDNSQEVKSCGSILTKLYLEDHVLTEKDVLDHLFSLTTAGYDTISITMMWCLYILGHHPQAQEKAYNEVVSMAPEGDIAFNDLAEMKYLDCVIKETMRLYSPVPIVTKIANRDIECGPYTIPKGTEVFIFIFMLHRDPNVFPEPEKFDPERFYDTSRLRPWMYIPFAEGYRYCIGKRYAMTEMKIQLAHLLRRFKITSLRKIEDNELDNTVILKPAVIPQLLFEKRQSIS